MNWEDPILGIWHASNSGPETPATGEPAPIGESTASKPAPPLGHTHTKQCKASTHLPPVLLPSAGLPLHPASAGREDKKESQGSKRRIPENEGDKNRS